jgi:hypothetical protein
MCLEPALGLASRASAWGPAGGNSILLLALRACPCWGVSPISFAISYGLYLTELYLFAISYYITDVSVAHVPRTLGRVSLHTTVKFKFNRAIHVRVVVGL